jgi:hypothetical protein
LQAIRPIAADAPKIEDLVGSFLAENPGNQLDLLPLKELNEALVEFVDKEEPRALEKYPSV